MSKVKIIKILFKDIGIIIGILLVLSFFFIVGFSINSINTESGCIGDYVEKLQKGELTGGCSRYCNEVFHQDKCDKSFKDIGCKLVAYTDGCSLTLYNPYWSGESIIDKTIFITTNTVACHVDYFWVNKFGNKNWREIFLSTNK